MKPTRRQFLQTSALATFAATHSFPEMQPDPATGKTLDAFEIARRHSITRDLPTPNFFEGMLLGNGDVGVCVVLRPDALGLHLGKNDCWDIRLSDESQSEVLPFGELLKLWQRASDEAKRQGKPDMLFLEQNIDFFREYTHNTEASYVRPWPRPWPCGTVWLHWDVRWVQPATQCLDPANGVYRLKLTSRTAAESSRESQITCFVDRSTGLISVSADTAIPFTSVAYYPRIDEGQRAPGDPDGTKPRVNALPPPELDSKTSSGSAEFSCFQYLPAIGPTEKVPSPPKSDKDRNFSLCARVVGGWSIEPDEKKRKISLKPNSVQPLRLDIKLATPREVLLEKLRSGASKAVDANTPRRIPQNHDFDDHDLDTRAYALSALTRAATISIDQLQRECEGKWRDFWSRSALELRDKELERIWYLNQYFLACCLRSDCTAPGLFANWSSGDLGTSWHGDYHLDYNCQQVFWGVFSSNHTEQHLPYVDLCEDLLEMCEKFTKEKFQLPGACFPLTAVPVPSQSVFIASPPYAYQISNTPWTVQSLWWHYLYTQDEAYLRRAYPTLRAASRFLAAYAKKDADGRYHFIPTASPENWGCTVDFRLNKDCILDLALAQFLFDAVIEASTLLHVDEPERAQWKNIRDHLADYPKGKNADGEVWLDVLDAPLEAVYNVPVTLAPVFPGEQAGIGRAPEQMEIAHRTALSVRLEGGNDLVFQPLIRARLGVLDLDWFKREVRYCTLPNGVANDRVRQIGGRYDDSSDFDFMMRMGFWTENFSLPAVLNECMMQSYTGVIYLFPNTKNLGPVRFQNLRAAGAFQVSAAHDGKSVTDLSLASEKGRTARLASPWPSRKIKVTQLSKGKAVPVRIEKGIWSFETETNEQYRIEPA